MHALRLITALVLIVLPGFAGAELPPIQPLIDAASPNDTVVPPPGVYAGPLTLNKPLTIDGQRKVTIDAGGSGSVVYVNTDSATVKNLHLTRSGESLNDLDAGVQVRGSFNVIKDNIIDDCLFGVDLQQAKNNIIRKNRISSKDIDLGQRGDSVRLWYSFNNKITDNIISNVRDMVVWYSADNYIARNTSSYGRYSLHFMYSRYNKVEYNRYFHNTVGIFLMYSDGVEVLHNHIAHAVGATGIGIGCKETSGITVISNEVLYCASGLSLDVSPFEPDTTNYFEGNLVAYNSIGVKMHNDWQGNVFVNNQFAGNMTQVFVSGGRSAKRNDWEGNYWSDYEGFDRDADGVGDSPHEFYAYADRIWRDIPHAQFFKGSPILEALDFLERLAPFTQPDLVLRDTSPRMQKQIEPMNSKGERPSLLLN